MITDILIYEVGSGGDLLLRGNDFASITGLENSPYLAMFGGYDWWGNDILVPDNPYNCLTEKALIDNPLTSAGRLKIEEAIRSDLLYLNSIPDTTYSISTQITAPDRLDITININGQLFSLSWNPDKLFLTYSVS